MIKTHTCTDASMHRYDGTKVRVMSAGKKCYQKIFRVRSQSYRVDSTSRMRKVAAMTVRVHRRFFAERRLVWRKNLEQVQTWKGGMWTQDEFETRLSEEQKRRIEELNNAPSTDHSNDRNYFNGFLNSPVDTSVLQDIDQITREVIEYVQKVTGLRQGCRSLTDIWYAVKEALLNAFYYGSGFDPRREFSISVKVNKNSDAAFSVRMMVLDSCQHRFIAPERFVTSNVDAIQGRGLASIQDKYMTRVMLLPGGNAIREKTCLWMQKEIVIQKKAASSTLPITAAPPAVEVAA